MAGATEQMEAQEWASQKAELLTQLCDDMAELALRKKELIKALKDPAMASAPEDQEMLLAELSELQTDTRLLAQEIEQLKQQRQQARGQDAGSVPGSTAYSVGGGSSEVSGPTATSADLSGMAPPGSAAPSLQEQKAQLLQQLQQLQVKRQKQRQRYMQMQWQEQQQQAGGVAARKKQDIAMAPAHTKEDKRRMNGGVASLRVAKDLVGASGGNDDDDEPQIDAQAYMYMGGSKPPAPVHTRPSPSRAGTARSRRGGSAKEKGREGFAPGIGGPQDRARRVGAVIEMPSTPDALRKEAKGHRKRFNGGVANFNMATDLAMDREFYTGRDLKREQARRDWEAIHMPTIEICKPDPLKSARTSSASTAYRGPKNVRENVLPEGMDNSGLAYLEVDHFSDEDESPTATPTKVREARNARFNGGMNGFAVAGDLVQKDTFEEVVAEVKKEQEEPEDGQLMVFKQGQFESANRSTTALDNVAAGAMSSYGTWGAAPMPAAYAPMPMQQPLQLQYGMAAPSASYAPSMYGSIASYAQPGAMVPYAPVPQTPYTHAPATPMHMAGAMVPAATMQAPMVGPMVPAQPMMAPPGGMLMLPPPTASTSYHAPSHIGSMQPPADPNLAMVPMPQQHYMG